MMAKDSTDITYKESEQGIVSTAAVPLARSHLTQKHNYAPNNTLNLTLSDNQHSKPVSVENQSASLAIEAAVAIVINGIHYAVLMASPNQLEELALGFLYSEGLIEHSRDLLDWEVTQLSDAAKLKAFTQDAAETIQPNHSNFEHLLDYDTYLVELVLSQRRHQRIQAQKRQLAGRTGCGMCGITGLNQALPDLSHYVLNKKTKTAKPSLQSLLSIRAQVDAMQHTHQLTGAVHAAASLHKDQLYLFEDVGRHNALDKLIGWQLRQKAEVDCVVMTSRLSIELVQKAIRMQLPWLVGMSAPTSTAVRVAERYGLGLAGFLRDDRVTYYTNTIHKKLK
ncbi:formate dehydrogenase accessory sulfurtransferase FdhD [Psychrobacter sp. 1U2]|uniref:formate dehydrogenase accessory sulfurtransferase FdhD n=1 Tax=Psychrobacter sp. 1U2 TaxID=3453577 RepID=UPI003F467BEE